MDTFDKIYTYRLRFTADSVLNQISKQINFEKSVRAMPQQSQDVFAKSPPSRDFSEQQCLQSGVVGFGVCRAAWSLLL